jgi:hypothetical protein
MTEPSSANVELTILLPLGVIANQLMKVAADLRFLNAKTLAYAKQRPGGDLAAQVAGRLEKINEVLEQIRDLITDFEADIELKSAGPTPPSDPLGFRKPHPDRDD